MSLDETELRIFEFEVIERHAFTYRVPGRDVVEAYKFLRDGCGGMPVKDTDNFIDVDESSGVTMHEEGNPLVSAILASDALPGADGYIPGINYVTDVTQSLTDEERKAVIEHHSGPSRSSAVG